MARFSFFYNSFLNFRYQLFLLTASVFHRFRRANFTPSMSEWGRRCSLCRSLHPALMTTRLIHSCQGKLLWCLFRCGLSICGPWVSWTMTKSMSSNSAINNLCILHFKLISPTLTLITKFSGHTAWEYSEGACNLNVHGSCWIGKVEIFSKEWLIMLGLSKNKSHISHPLTEEQMDNIQKY